jgi:pimeloyl-ACP methyl ester carboxylesterase
MNFPLIFIHGAGDSALAWKEQIAFFGTRARAIDLPGHGQRPDNLPEKVSVLDYARAAWGIIQQELQLEQPVVVGHSLGGLVALQMGLEYGPALGGLVLIGTGARMRVLPALLEAARTDQEQALRTLKQYSISAQHAQALSARLAQEPARLQPGILYRDLLACHTFDVMDQLQLLAEIPTFILCGADERNAPVKYSEYLHAQIAHSTLLIVPEAGHYVQREKPAEVNQALEDWLEKIHPLDAL